MAPLPNRLPGLNFDLGETADLLRSSVEGFAAEEIAPRAAAIDRENQFPMDLWPKLGGLGVYQALRPLIIGIVHGLAGSAAVALLVLTAIDDPLWGMVYLLLFGVGTIGGMMIVTLLIAAPFAYSQDRFPRFSGYLRIASGLLSVVFGLFLMYYIGYVDGLFGANPQWTPAVTIESAS